MAQLPTPNLDPDRSQYVTASSEAEFGDVSKTNDTRENVEQGFIDLINNWKDAIKPWSEFLSPKCFGLPLPVKHLLKRIKANISHFPANYVVIILLLAFCCIITSFWLLISTILISVIFAFIRSKTSKGPLVVGDEEIPSWFLYAAAVFAVIPLLILADVGYLLYCAVGSHCICTIKNFWQRNWRLYAVVLGTSIILILIHAIFYSGLSKKKLNKAEEPQVIIHKSKETSENNELLRKAAETVTEEEVSKASRVRFTEDNK